MGLGGGGWGGQKQCVMKMILGREAGIGVVRQETGLVILRM